MAITSAQLSAAISASATQFGIQNVNGSGLPAVGALPLPIGFPMLIDAEFMYCYAQPILGIVQVRGRGSEGSAAAPHDVLANVATSNVPGDLGAPSPGTVVTIEPNDDLAIALGQDQTLTLPGANAIYSINKVTALNLTLPAPSLAMNGLLVTFTSMTPAAHVITGAGLFNDGATGVPHSTATFAAFAGATLSLVAENGLWNLAAQPRNVTVA